MAAIPRPAVHRTNKTVKIPVVVRAASRLARPLQKVVKKTVTKPVAAPRVQPTNKIVRSVQQRKQARLVPPTNHRKHQRQSLPSPEVDLVSTPRNQQMMASLKNTGVDRILVIIGNGPSVSEVNLAPLKTSDKIDIMSVNKPVSSLWPSRYWVFCDYSQYRRHIDLWNSYEGIIINTRGVRPQRPNAVKVHNRPSFGFSTNLFEGVHVGRSSVYVAMQVAAWMNYPKVYIFGCDMRAIEKDGQLVTHFFGTNPDAAPKNRIARFDSEAKHYTYAGDQLSEEIRSRYIFCTSYNQYSFVDRFNRLDHKTAVDTIMSTLG